MLVTRRAFVNSTSPIPLYRFEAFRPLFASPEVPAPFVALSKTRPSVFTVYSRSQFGFLTVTTVLLTL
jgi:hypothetical protein